MKLSNLSFAVIMALGVVACGGSGGNPDNQTVPESPAPAPEPAPAPDASTHDSTLVDPTRTHVVDDRDLLKEVTVGSLQYVRRDGSDYDRNYNPEQRASSTPLLGVSLNEQNPKLTNIVLARQDLLRADGQPVRAQFAGGLSPEPLTREGKPQSEESLQIENYQNVDILAGAFKQFGSAAVHTDGATPINSYAFGDKFDYDTHVQDNIDKSGEHTRERVSHNYTIRYEYKQPYVDYPHAANAGDIRREDANPPTGIATKPPMPPSLPAIDTLQSALIQDAAWSTTDANDNSRHPVNVGTGGYEVFGAFVNNEKNYGNRTIVDTPANAAWAQAWRNMGTYSGSNHIAPLDMLEPPHPRTAARNPAPWRDAATAAKENVVDWRRSFRGNTGADWYVNRAAGLPPGAALPANVVSEYNYRQPYPNGAYPVHLDTGNGTVYSYKSIYPNTINRSMSGYPLVEYDQTRNNTLSGGNADGNPKNHEHIYLEQEEFSAIRTVESIRPLVNPVANEWDWELQQRWTWIEHHQRWIPERRDQNGNLISHGYWVYWDVPRDASGTDDFYQTGVIGACTGTCYSTSQITLQHAYWQKPDNLGGGIQGEFRSPLYWGWDDNTRTIRYNDERIWKPGTPGYKPEYERKYGANLIWWSTQDSAFENWATAAGANPRARRVDINTDKSSEDLVWGKANKSGTDARDHDIEIQPTGDITNGLIRIGNGMPTLGEELKWDESAKTWKDHHNTTSRIFGRYHLAYADQEKGDIKPVSLNSYQGARSFVARVKDRLNGNGYQQGNQTFWADLESEAEKYSIGAQPITLKKVQYGRVTTNLDLDMGEGPHDGGFLQAPFAYKNDGAAVDNYFYRGIDATSLEQMAAVTANNGMARYEGHALMYGIDNAYKGITEIKELSENAKPLPNAFSIPDHGTPDVGTDNGRLGLGNFVQAEVNFGTKKVSGEVYNAWLLDQNKAAVTKDLLVHFKGDIMGNTVIGSADRTYIKGDDKADFRASFFGEKAEEMGGAFNSVTREQKYGSAYEDGDWGGVFGAKQVGSGNTFQGDDGANVYNGL